LTERGGTIHWAADAAGRLGGILRDALNRLAAEGCTVFLSLDADAVHAADVPGVSAPNPQGLLGSELPACARFAGRSAHVSSFELAEINPTLDRDNQSTRWAALAVWSFMAGLAQRG
jgi:formiminoglutamase